MKDLSEREQEVLNHLYTPKSQRQISEDLGIALGTLKVHCKRIYKKINVIDRVQLMGEKINTLEVSLDNN